MQKNRPKFKILEHTADLKIKAFGKNKKELFLNMLKGMSESQRAEIENENKINRKIEIQSLDLSTLLIDFLSEALYLSQVNREVYFGAKFTKFTDTEIKGELIGQKVKRFGLDIKGVTYHSLDIRQRKDGTWEATVLFDI
jgi:SHS2 domain-containing protein